MRLRWWRLIPDSELAIACVMLALIGGVAFWIGAGTWPYATNTLAEFTGSDARMTWWQGGLLGLFPPTLVAGVSCWFFAWIMSFAIK